MAEITDIKEESNEEENQGLSQEESGSEEQDRHEIEELGGEIEDGNNEEQGSEGSGTEEEKEEEEVIKQYCKGSFRMMFSTDFTQNENYSDDYLKSKGLFKATEPTE